MKKVFVFITCALFLLAGCSNSLIKKTSSIVISLPGSSYSRAANPEELYLEDIDHFSIKVESADKNVSIAKKAGKGESVVFEELEAGTYEVSLYIYGTEEEDTYLDYQTKTAEVYGGNETSVSFSFSVPFVYRYGYYELSSGIPGAIDNPISDYSVLKSTVGGITSKEKYPTAVYISGNFNTDYEIDSDVDDIADYYTGINVTGNVQLRAVDGETAPEITALENRRSIDGTESNALFYVGDGAALDLYGINLKEGSGLTACLIDVGEKGTVIIDGCKITGYSGEIKDTALINVAEYGNLSVINCEFYGAKNVYASEEKADVIYAKKYADITLENVKLDSCGLATGAYANIYLEGRAYTQNGITSDPDEGKLTLNGITCTDCAYNTTSGYGNIYTESDAYVCGDLNITQFCLGYYSVSDSTIYKGSRFPVLHRIGKINVNNKVAFAVHPDSALSFAVTCRKIIDNSDDKDSDTYVSEIFTSADSAYVVSYGNILAKNAISETEGSYPATIYNYVFTGTANESGTEYTATNKAFRTISATYNFFTQKFTSTHTSSIVNQAKVPWITIDSDQTLNVFADQVSFRMNSALDTTPSSLTSLVVDNGGTTNLYNMSMYGGEKVACVEVNDTLNLYNTCLYNESFTVGDSVSNPAVYLNPGNTAQVINLYGYSYISSICFSDISSGGDITFYNAKIVVDASHVVTNLNKMKIYMKEADLKEFSGLGTSIVENHSPIYKVTDLFELCYPSTIESTYIIDDEGKIILSE